MSLKSVTVLPPLACAFGSQIWMTCLLNGVYVWKRTVEVHHWPYHFVSLLCTYISFTVSIYIMAKIQKF